MQLRSDCLDILLRLPKLFEVFELEEITFLTRRIALENSCYLQGTDFLQFVQSARPWNTVSPLENKELKIALQSVT